MKYKVLMSLVIIALLLIPACEGTPQQNLEPYQIIQNWTVENETHFLRLCEENNLTDYFRKSEYGNYSSYHSQGRAIEGVPVEGDGFGFSFEDGKLLGSYSHWREDLPDKLPPTISKEEAIRIVGGDANTTAKLVYIEPGKEWDISPTDNPCWVVRIWEWYEDTNERTGEVVGSLFNTNVIVVDAVLGIIIGYGIPYP